MSVQDQLPRFSQFLIQFSYQIIVQVSGLQGMKEGTKIRKSTKFIDGKRVMVQVQAKIPEVTLSKGTCAHQHTTGTCVTLHSHN